MDTFLKLGLETNPDMKMSLRQMVCLFSRGIYTHILGLHLTR